MLPMEVLPPPRTPPPDTLAPVNHQLHPDLRSFRSRRPRSARVALLVLSVGVALGALWIQLERGSRGNPEPALASARPLAAPDLGSATSLGERAASGPSTAPALRELSARPEPLDIATGVTTAMFTEKELKQLDKLAKKHAKQSAKLDSLESLADDADSQASAAQDALDALLADAPGNIWEWLDWKKELKAAEKAVKKWNKKAAKYAKKLAKAETKLADLEGAIEEIDPQYFESGAGDDEPPPGDVSIPVLVQEALTSGAAGVDRLASVATFGLPFHEDQDIAVIDGRPQLGVSGADRWQFEPLALWPDGDVRWALLHVQTDVAAGNPTVGLVVTEGDGSTNQTPIGDEDASEIQLDTGPLLAVISKSSFNLFKQVWVDGVKLVDSGEPGLSAESVGGQSLVPSDDTEVVLEENGPARAVVRATGALATSGGSDVVDFTCRIIARAGSRDLEVQLTVRNANESRQQHVQLEGLELSVDGSLGSGSKAVTISKHDGEHEASISGGTNAHLFVGHTGAAVEGLNSSAYLPHLPEQGDGFVYEGYRLTVGGSDVHSFGDEDQYPEHPWLDVTGSKGGVTVAIQHMAHLWPASLEATGGGRVVAGLFTDRNPAPYAWSWRQHESRTAVFSFHAGDAVDPDEVPLRLDLPLTGRALDYLAYDEARVLPYRLVTEDQAELAFDAMGLGFHEVVAPNGSLLITRYLYKGTTGGSNNHARIEKQLGSEWLRHGNGGKLLNGLDLALYKSEWQVKRSDGFHHDDSGEATNADDVDTSWGHFSDDEHRYRDGMILAYHLTGDRRIRDALLDECEVLQDIFLWPHERSMYQTIRAMGLVCEFVTTVAPLLDTPAERAFAQAQAETLTQILRERLEYITTPTIDIHSEDAGEGWEAAPGTGSRRYFVNSADNKDEKPPGENFQCRGFISASLGPLGYYHAARWLETLAEWKGVGDPDYDDLMDEAERARLRMIDLSYWTKNELFPYVSDPEDRHLVYSYAVTLQDWTITESYDFHPIHLGMIESWRDPDAGLPSERQEYLERGLEQFEAHAAHDNGPYADNLYLLDHRLDVQHFLRLYLESTEE